MAFFTRPDLNDIQFKQTSGSTLTLSGTTRIDTPEGLSIVDENGSYIPLVVTGGTNGEVWTYVNGKMILSDATSGGIYNGLSPTTCTVGGLPSNSNISGCTISCILQDILVPVRYPTFINPSISVSTDLNSSYEVGEIINGYVKTEFNMGCINPAYGTTGYRSGDPNTYKYFAFGESVDVSNTGLSYDYDVVDYVVCYGDNIVQSRVAYDEGPQPKDSRGSNYCDTLPAGCTSYSCVNVCGYYPYYYGVYDAGNVPAGNCRPVIGPNEITGGTKIISSSMNTVCINFNSTAYEYIWLAIPQQSTLKTKWYVNPLNNGDIGGSITPGGNLFPTQCLVTDVNTTIWNGVGYNVYLSNYQTKIETIMEFRNN